MFSSECVISIISLIGMRTCSSCLLSQSELVHLSGYVSTSLEGKLPAKTTQFVNTKNHKGHSLSTWILLLDPDNIPEM